MLSYTTLPRHKPRRKLKKYQHYCVRKDKDFRGPRVYVYGSFSACVFTAKPRWKGSASLPFKLALWMNWNQMRTDRV